jgi:hypothetical protein
MVAPPGEAVIVHTPEDGKPVRTTEPVVVAHVGCVTVPRTGAVGLPGTVLMVAVVADAADVHVPLFTVNEYVPGASPLKEAVDPDPVIVLPFEEVTVQVPVAGSPLRSTEPVGVEHVG